MALENKAVKIHAKTIHIVNLKQIQSLDLFSCPVNVNRIVLFSDLFNGIKGLIGVSPPCYRYNQSLCPRAGTLLTC